MGDNVEMQAMVKGDASNEAKVKEERERIEANANQLHSHSQQKNFTKGFADLALLTANVSQLRHVLQLQDDTMRTLNIVLLSLSIFLQVILHISNVINIFLYFLSCSIFPPFPNLNVTVRYLLCK